MLDAIIRSLKYLTTNIYTPMHERVRAADAQKWAEENGVCTRWDELRMIRLPNSLTCIVSRQK